MFLGLSTGAPDGSCVYQPAALACPQMTMGIAQPDLNWRLGLTNKDSGDNVYVYAETTDVNSYGSICGLKVDNSGLGMIGGAGHYSFQYSALTSGITPSHPTDPGPIDAKISNLTGAPVVAVRTIGSGGLKTQSVAYYDPSTTAWAFLMGSALTSGGVNYDVANSISISGLPAQTNTLSGVYVGESLFAVGTDGTLWEDKFQCTLAAGPSCSGGYALAGISSNSNNGTALDSTTDSMTASWYTGSSAKWAEAYSATTNAAVSDADQSDRFGGAMGSWLQYNPGTSGWVAGAAYDGQQTTVRADFGGGGGTHEDWIAGACHHNATDYICILRRPYGSVTSLPWSFMSM